MTISPWWLVVAVFVVADQLQASITGFCPAASILRRFGVGAAAHFAETSPSVGHDEGPGNRQGPRFLER